MAKNKYYAVKVGKVPGIYQSWSKAEEQVRGFSGAKFKSFSTEKEAEQYMSDMALDMIDVKDTVDKVNESIIFEIKNLLDNQVIAFVDGSYLMDKGEERYSFGAVLITNKGEYNLCQAFTDKDKIDSRQVAGEIEGVKQSILWAIQNKKTEIKIFYDYDGIEKWAKKEWKANKKLTQDYVKFMEEYFKKIKITFEHTKAHTGIEYNEKADRLAKSVFSHKTLM